MYKHKRKDEEEPYVASYSKNIVVDDVGEELAGTKTFLTDTQGLKLAYENPEGIYQNGSMLYIAGTKSGGDVYDDLNCFCFRQETPKDTKTLMNLSKMEL